MTYYVLIQKHREESFTLHSEYTDLQEAEDDAEMEIEGTGGEYIIVKGRLRIRTIVPPPRLYNRLE